jgi:hypothetical protein
MKKRTGRFPLYCALPVTLSLKSMRGAAAGILDPSALLRTGFGFWTSDSMNQVSLLGSLVSLYGQSRALRRYVIPIQSPSSQML